MSHTRVELRVYETEKAKLRAQAASKGFSMSEYLRRLVEWDTRQELRTSIYPQSKVRTITKP